ncbi:hypothetical protein D6764_01085 [Candidatus Woesearchaeota archaeon]|nr:MAG: hypothetical protein D6764_01085 [Candidatus Woesearchaeota archaeon]
MASRRKEEQKKLFLAEARALYSSILGDLKRVALERGFYKGNLKSWVESDLFFKDDAHGSSSSEALHFLFGPYLNRHLGRLVMRTRELKTWALKILALSEGGARKQVSDILSRVGKLENLLAGLRFSNGEEDIRPVQLSERIDVEGKTVFLKIISYMLCSPKQTEDSLRVLERLGVKSDAIPRLQRSPRKREAIEKSAISIIRSCIETALRKNPDLLKSNLTTINVRLEPPLSNERGPMTAASVKSRSPFTLLDMNIYFGNLFANLLLEEGLSESRKNVLLQRIYKTILHELEHFGEFGGNKEDSPAFSVSVFLENLRAEAIAGGAMTIRSAKGEKILADFSRAGLVFHKYRDDLRLLLARSDRRTLWHLEAYDSGALHSFATFMFWTIFAAKSFDFTSLWLCPRELLVEKKKLESLVLNNDTHVLRGFGCRQVNNHAFGRHIFSGQLIMVIESVKRANEVLRSMELMSAEKFLEAFWKACRKVEVDPAPLSPHYLESLL